MRWTLLVFIWLVSDLSNEAHAERRSWGWRRSETNQSLSSQYYRPTQQNLQTEVLSSSHSSCEHSSDGSQCHHRYEVRGNYRVDGAGGLQGKGVLGYRGEETHYSSHNGSASTVASIDEDAALTADRYSRMASELKRITESRLNLKTSLARVQQSARYGQVSYAHANAAGRLLSQFDSFYDKCADHTRSTDVHERNRLAKEIVDDVEQLLEQSLEYARFYEPESYQNTLVTLTLVRALRRM